MEVLCFESVLLTVDLGEVLILAKRRITSTKRKTRNQAWCQLKRMYHEN